MINKCYGIATPLGASVRVLVARPRHKFLVELGVIVIILIIIANNIYGALFMSLALLYALMYINSSLTSLGSDQLMH